MEAADEFNSRTSELVVQAVSDPVLQSSTTLKVEKALKARAVSREKRSSWSARRSGEMPIYPVPPCRS